MAFLATKSNMEKKIDRMTQTVEVVKDVTWMFPSTYDGFEKLTNLFNDRQIRNPQVAERCVQFLWEAVTCVSFGRKLTSSRLPEETLQDTKDARPYIPVPTLLSRGFSPLVGAAIFQRFLCAAPEEKLRIHDPLSIPQREPLQISEVCERHLDLTARALVKGVDPEFLLSRCTGGSPLLLDLLSIVVKLCSKLHISRYRALHTLLAWLDTTERLMKDQFRISDAPMFRPESREVDAVMAIVSANWETALKGVPDLAKECYASLLRLHVLERGSKPVEASADLHAALLDDTMRMSWACKPKFRSLACLLEHVGLEECVGLDPDLPRRVIGSFSSTHLASAAADVYKASLSSKGGRRANAGDLWALHWLGAIVEAVLDGSGVHHQNLTTHLLPWTLSNVPDSFAAICAALEKRQLADSSFLLTLFRIAKQTGTSSAAENYELIDRFVHHARVEVRAEVLGALCSCHAKSSVPGDEAVRRIREFLPENLNVDDAWFRTELTLHVENLVIRLRDRAVTELARSSKHRGKREIKTSDAFAKIMSFVEWLVNLCVQNLFPGANYQRLITCVTILEAVFGTFSKDPKGKRKMTQRKEELESMLNHVKVTYKKLDPGQPRTQQALMQCLFHSAEDVRNVAFQVLVSDDSVRLSSDAKLFTVAKKFVSSPKVHDTAVGAMLARLYLRRWNGNKVNVIHGMTAIYEACRRECDAVRANLAEAVRGSPAHGAMLALATCLSDEDVRKDLKKMGHLDFYLRNSFNLAEGLLYDVLAAMDPSDASRAHATDLGTRARTAPSFEDTDHAFLQLIGRKWEGDGPPSKADPTVALLLEKMYACTWLCIKNSCKLFEELIRAWSENSIALEKKDIEDMNATFVDILLDCRHRGAIESCYDSYRVFCQHVTRATDPDIGLIPAKNIETVFVEITSSSQSTSVTRRSAGHPLLLRALVESNPKCLMTFLVSAVSELEEASKSPLPEATTDVDWEVDVVHAKVLHILCNLVSAASLSMQVLPYLGCILQFALEGLRAPIWAIVNAAHQLYGAVVPRILGQKKTKDSGGHNAMTAVDLFASYPSLYKYFLLILTYSGKDTVFVLDFLSRLTPARSLSKDQENLLKPFLAALDKMFCSSSWSQRLLVAKCYSLLCTPQAHDLDRLLFLLDGNGEACPNNHMQAVLRLSNLLLQANPSLAADLAKEHEERLTSFLDRLIARGCYPNCQEYITLLESVLPEQDRRWRQLFRDRCFEEVGRKVDRSMPGSSQWKVLQTTWLLRALHRGDHADMLRIVDAAKDDDDVLEGVVTFMLEHVEDDVSQLPLHTWRQTAGRLVDFCSKSCMSRTLKVQVLDLLVQLCQKRGFLEVYFLHRTFKMAKEQATKEGCCGTSTKAAALLLWSVCINSVLCEQLGRRSPKVFRELEEWAATVSDLSKPTADELLRLGAARSFAVMGRLPLNWVAEYVPLPTTTVYSLFGSLLTLLQDEVRDIRTNAAATFVTTAAGQKEVIAALPKLIKLNPVVVKEVFNRLLGSNVESSANFTSPVTPAELLIALHTIDPSKCDVKTVIKATSLCFAEKHVYTQEVLAVVMQQLMEHNPLPTLLMRTVIQSLTLYPRLIGFVMNILQRLILKQVWKQKKVWEGFIKCCQRTRPQSLQVLLQLPAEHLRNVFQVSPDLQDPLVQHVASFTDHQKAHIPKSILDLLKVSRSGSDSERTCPPTIKRVSQRSYGTAEQSWQEARREGPEEPPPPGQDS